MDARMLPVYIIVFLVLIVLPVFLAKKSGKSPMEILFGKQAGDGFFGKRNRKENAGSEGDESAVPGGAVREKNKKALVEKNSSRQELMKAISAFLTYGRKHRFYCIVPGTLMHEDKVATLAALIVTRSRVLGFNCFGYGGTVYAGNGDEPWRQVLNGNEQKIDSPVVRNRKQREILDSVLKECGYPDLPTEIYGVFTASKVTLKDNRNTRCYTQEAMMEILQGRRFTEDNGVDPVKVGKALEAHVKKKA